MYDMMRCGSFCLNLRDRIQPWLRDYDRLQSFAVILIYIQVLHRFLYSLTVVNEN